jgi:hypothetical protein
VGKASPPSIRESQNKSHPAISLGSNSQWQAQPLAGVDGEAVQRSGFGWPISSSREPKRYQVRSVEHPFRPLPRTLALPEWVAVVSNAPGETVDGSQADARLIAIWEASLMEIFAYVELSTRVALFGTARKSVSMDTKLAAGGADDVEP